ncbi:muscarinic acetylcholine receptor DM1-like isoform X2 [Daphnia pulicaria]|uniref:muscarinic acetylcholine receptor DM1-like isoform X2 n=1 Tax=Daphnia pulicaria TaxID=35523 RepID=UPI001EE9BE1D|nr:muscarinic acetylcholine receptor DM1-like isoform X2 [Daphnia pulicaria]
MSLSALNQTAPVWASSGASSSRAGSSMMRAAATAAAAGLQYVTANISDSLPLSSQRMTAGSTGLGFDDFTDEGSSSVLFSQQQWTSGNNTTGTMAEDDFVLPYSYPEMVLIAIVAGFLSFLTVAGNCMVMISFKIDKQLQTISNYFLFSLAVADFAIGLISMPLFTVYILAGRWQLGPYVCDTWLSLDYLASNASVLNLLIISFDRYFSVTRPLTYRARRTPRRAGVMIAAAWVISLVLWPPWIYAWPYIEGDRKVPEDKCFIQFIETNNYITFGTAIAAFYAPVTVMCVLYWRVWRETEKRQKDLSNLQAGKKNDSHRSNSSGEEQAVLMKANDEVDHHLRPVGAATDWRRSRSESSGAVDDLETSYVPAAACLPGPHRRHYAGSWTSWAYWRRWMRWSTWQHWMRNLTRRQPQRPRRRGDRTGGGGGDTESYSDGSNVATTPASIETPLASSMSRGPSMNIRDPYSSTPTRYKAAAAAAAANDPRLIGVDRRRTLVASKSLTQDHHNKQLADGQMCPSPSMDNDDGDTDGGKRSHSADSVFTILIRLPADSSADKAEHKVSIRMIPANIPPAASHRSRASGSSTGSANQPAVRSRSVPVGNEQHDGYNNRSRPPGSGGSSASQYTSNRSLAARPSGSRSAQYNDSTSSLLCGTNLHLPNALSLSKLTALAKPNHLPLHKGKLKNHHASPWVPRSCMPVAQSPLIVRCTRFNGGSSGTPDSGDRTPSGALPMDAKIVPKHRAGGVGPAGGIAGSPAGSPAGALQTVSGSVANNSGAVGSSGLHPPIRRPNHNAYSPSAAAAAAAANKKANKKPKKKNQEKRQERKAAKTLSAILLAFILTWTPYNVLTLLKALAPCDKDDCFSSELWNFSYYLCYINSTINPVCYALCNASFRRTYVRILTCKWHSRTKTAVQRGVYN